MAGAMSKRDNQNQNIGFVQHQLGSNQISWFMIENLNKLTSYRPHLNIVLFYEELQALSVVTKFPMMELAWANNLDGDLIALDISTALRIREMNYKSKLFYYPQQLDWVVKPGHIELYERIYNNDEIEIIAPNKTYGKIIERVWKKPVETIRNFDYEQFATFISERCR